MGFARAQPILRAEQRQFPAMKKISPAFRIPIAHSELATLGELCAIQGQVEHLFIHTLHYVLDVKLDAARAILGHTSIHTNAHTWIAIFRGKCGDRAVIKMADEAFSLVAGITRGRNDFVHALFATPLGEGWLLHRSPKGRPHRRAKANSAIAIRTRDSKTRRPISDLLRVRNDAARLSVILSDIASSFLPD
jgi:hypothetical protein